MLLTPSSNLYSAEYAIVCRRRTTTPLNSERIGSLREEFRLIDGECAQYAACENFSSCLFRHEYRFSHILELRTGTQIARMNVEKEGIFARTIENLQKLDKSSVTACNSAGSQQSMNRKRLVCRLILIPRAIRGLSSSTLRSHNIEVR
jgi:hypothetical protein